MTQAEVPRFLLPQWEAPTRVRAAFTLRDGGVSRPPYDSLNLGAHVGDDPAAVEENRRRVSTALALPSEPTWLNQVHGANVLDVDRIGLVAGAVRTRPSADAIVTRRAGMVCCIQVADCLPVLFAARDGSVIGAAHAGWRGLAAGVLENIVRAMSGPGIQLVAWLGPAIGPTQFEVGEDVREVFIAHDKNSAAAFRPNDRGRWLCNLWMLAHARLLALGISSIAGSRWCTASDPAQFFSHRRDAGHSGRMAALLWLTGRA